MFSIDANLVTKWLFNMPIAHSTAFILWVCGGTSFTTVFIFCNSCFNFVDASFFIVFNFGAFTEFSHMSYTMLYARNMSVSLLVLLGYANISFLSYAYSINIYCIPLLLVNGKCSVKYVYNFLVLGSDKSIALW